LSIQLENISFSYGQRPVLRNISFCAEYGQILSVLGPNGAGKSTLFRCMLGLLTPSAGAISLDGQPICHMPPGQLARKIAYIPQSHNPVFNYSVLDMVLMGTASQLGPFRQPGEQQVKQAESALEQLGISHLKDRGYANLSGGERQMVLIARAIAQQAKLLIMDEPSASLDFGNRVRLMRVVRSLADAGYGIIQSTHDPDQAFLHSDRILALKDGVVMAWGTPREVMTAELTSALYGVQTEVYSIREDTVRLCVPAGEKIRQEEMKT